MSETNWTDYAGCKGRDVNMFFPEHGIKGTAKQIADAKAVCGICRVSAECLQTAIDNEEMFGIWGGLLPKERNKIRSSQSVSTKVISITQVKKYDDNKV